MDVVLVEWCGAYEALLPDGRRLVPGDRFWLPADEARERADVRVVVEDAPTALTIVDTDLEE